MNLFIFHRDLRLTDNTSLIELAKVGKEITPIFIFTPTQVRHNDYKSNNAIQFMVESLQELSKEIQSFGGTLYFFEGETLDVIKAICKEHKVDRVAYNVDYTPYARKRDQEIYDYCHTQDIKVISKEDFPLYPITTGSTLKKNGTPYVMFSPFKKYCMKNLKVAPVDKFNKWIFKKYPLGKIKYATEKLKSYYTENKNINVPSGRSYGLQILSRLNDFKDYSKNRDTFTYKTTFLSAHLHFNTVSIREVYHKVVEVLGKNSGIINELTWRDFYINVTYFFPRVLEGQIKSRNKSFKEEYDKIKWKTDKKSFQQWCDGQTGVPIVDACMRQLNTTGYMHNRGRMIVASFLTKDLHIDWREGEKYFATKLVDYDPMSNSGGWQWTMGGGTDPQPYYRIFNPYTQGKEHDPECIYIKKWVPELKDVEPKIIHKWGSEAIRKKIKVDYPEPIVDHDSERIEALSLYADLR
jgi:deoxyribodipyrimidine photo-lyase